MEPGGAPICRANNTSTSSRRAPVVAWVKNGAVTATQWGPRARTLRRTAITSWTGPRPSQIISWPAWIADVGATRFQFHHVIDVVPTILDVVGIAEPAMVDGVAQKPIEGVSMAYTFDRANANAPSARPTPHFEMGG